MGKQFYHSGNPSGFQYEKQNNTGKNDYDQKAKVQKLPGRDDDLVIDDNTVYEIDRECYERLKRQKKRKY